MDDRPNLQTFLEELLGSRNVYNDPPESVRMKYPAIKFSRSKINNTFANDRVYKQDDRYEVTTIHRDPDDEITRKISRLPKCVHDRHYVADNLHHNVFTLYY